MESPFQLVSHYSAVSPGQRGQNVSRPSIFLDRDGTLNESEGFVNHISRFRLFPWSTEAIRLINRQGYLAILVTNQSGVGRGLYSEALVRAVHQRFEVLLAESGARLDGIYYCVHDPSDKCDCRKPKPGMLFQAQKEHDIDLSRSFMIGDSYNDLKAGWAAGTRSALVRTGYGEGNYAHQRDSWDRQPEVFGANLYQVLCKIFWESGN